MTISTDQYNRLPLYARQEIDRLNANLGGYRDKLLQATGAKPGRSGTTVAVFCEPIGGLPEGARVTFRTEEGEIEVYQQKDGTISVRGQPGLVVKPIAGNVVEIEVRGF